jgi:hypothetical protein
MPIEREDHEKTTDGTEAIVSGFIPAHLYGRFIQTASEEAEQVSQAASQQPDLQQTVRRAPRLPQTHRRVMPGEGRLKI